jgi:hypothetical protein
MEISIPAGEHDIHFVLYPSLNLLAHTCNLLGMSLGGYGSKQYPLLQNKEAVDALKYEKRINNQLFDSWFGDPVRTLLMNKVDDVPRAISTIRSFDYRELPTLATILQNSWDNFYKSYWAENKDRFETESDILAHKIKWGMLLKQMETCTSSSLPMDFYTVLVEATANSATMLNPNIVTCTTNRHNYSSFVHEGLHLLIAASYGKYEKAINFMNSHELPENFRYKDWRGKIEQAVVISLDTIISKQPEYLDACFVGDLREPIYNEIKQWNESGSTVPLPDFLLGILRKHEKEIFVKPCSKDLDLNLRKDNARILKSI